MGSPADREGGDVEPEPTPPSAAVESERSLTSGPPVVVPTVGSGPGEEPPPQPVARFPRLRRRLLFGGAAALALLAAGLGGVVLGWSLHAERLSDQPMPQDVESADGYVSQALGEVIMPDVRGLSEADARQVLVDAGVADSAVAVTSRQAAGRVGVVVAQDPVFGSADPTSVDLVLSEPAVVPEIAGVGIDELVADLGALGALADVQRRYEAGVEAGTPLAIEPEPGQVLPEEVTITVADASGSVFLSDVDEVEGGCSSRSVSVNGTTYDRALLCGAGEAGRSTAWAVARVVDFVDGTVGVPDDGSAEAQVTVKVLADGREVASVDASYGRPAELHAQVTGALRITMVVLNRTPAREGRSAPSASAVLGDVRLVGGAQAMAVLTGSSSP